MKNVTLYLLFLFCVGVFHSPFFIRASPAPLKHTLAPTQDTVNFYLQINGSIRQMKNVNGDSGDNPWLDSAVVTVYQNNVVYTRVLTTRRGKCSIKLPLDRIYIVELSKPGYVSKKFEVNTKTPINKKDAYDFDFDMNIFEDIEGLNTQVLEKPIAIVFYNITNNQFEYDAAYTNRINNDLKLMYRNYYLLEHDKSKKKKK
jgi:hypothetical protein